MPGSHERGDAQRSDALGRVCKVPVGRGPPSGQGSVAPLWSPAPQGDGDSGGRHE